jgi:toxin YhaV
MQRQGWTLLFHAAIIAQLRRLQAAAERAERNDPRGFEGNANVKLFRALSQLILNVVPSDPARDEYRQGNTLKPAYRHWRRAKIGRRFRLFFRYDSRAKVIVYAWVNDTQTLRSSGSSSDPYTVFGKMLDRDNPPDDWTVLMAASRADWNEH